MSALVSLRRAPALLGTGVLLLTASACASSTRPIPTAKRDANGVTVTVRLIAEAAGPRHIEATFTPDKPGFHVYSLDLPDGGVQGIGVPTRLTVQGGLAAAGEPAADRTAVAFTVTGTGVTLPVYPDGSVTLTLPVTQTGSPHADVVVSYGACSPATCLMPVTDERIPLTVG